MDEDFQKKLAALDMKLDAVFRSVEKTRTYLLWTLIISVAMVVLPLIGLVFIIPQLISTYSSLLTF